MFDPKQRIDTIEGTARLAFEDDWTPVALPNSKDGCLFVIWAKIGTGPFDAPFFDSDAQERLKTAQWFSATHQSLHEYAINSPGVPLKGVVWHMSRCGSTLAKSLLAATDHSVAISEPGFINRIVARMSEDPNGPCSTILSSALNCFIRPNGTNLTRGYLKCTSWNVLLAPQMHAQAPSVPCIFIHRDPLLVLASLQKGMPGWTASESFLFDMCGMKAAENPLVRAADILAKYLEEALRAEASGYCRLVAYKDINSRFVDGDLPEYFGYEVTPTVREKMAKVFRFSSKNPSVKFVPDEESKRAFARNIPGLEEIAEKKLGRLYNEILLRTGQTHTS